MQRCTAYCPASLMPNSFWHLLLNEAKAPLPFHFHFLFPNTLMLYDHCTATTFCKEKHSYAKMQVNPAAECYQHLKFCSMSWSVIETFPTNWQWLHTGKLKSGSRNKQVNNKSFNLGSFINIHKLKSEETFALVKSFINRATNPTGFQVSWKCSAPPFYKKNTHRA